MNAVVVGWLSLRRATGCTISSSHQWCFLPGLRKIPLSLLANNLCATVSTFCLPSLVYLILECPEEITLDCLPNTRRWVTTWWRSVLDISKNEGQQCLATLWVTQTCSKNLYLMFPVEISLIYAFILIFHRLKAFWNWSWTDVPRRLIHLAISWAS